MTYYMSFDIGPTKDINGANLQYLQELSTSHRGSVLIDRAEGGCTCRFREAASIPFWLVVGLQ